MKRPLNTTRFAQGGPIAWMARHPVMPNLLMLVLVLGGLLFSGRITQEVYPNYELDSVSISVALPGATPAEVEQSVVLPVEEALASVQGIAKVTATAREGSAAVVAEIDESYERQVVYNDVAQAIARISTFPGDAEAPTVALSERRREVLEIQFHGRLDLRSLRMAAEHVRERLLAEEGISQVEIGNARDMEILVEIPRASLRAHGLTAEEVAATIRAAALDRGGGTVEAESGDILLRLADRRDTLDEFARIPVLTDATGTVLRLGEIARLGHGFADSRDGTTWNGSPSLRLDVYRVGAETPIGVSDAVRRALPDALSTLPEAVDAIIVDDDSEVYRARLELLLKNGFMGLVIVLVLLSLFLEFRLAFWVAVGIPTAFLGTLLFLPSVGVTINMVSLFAFILALGIVVDDAIVVGENIYEYLERGLTPVEAAVQGARDIAVPLSFSILTNVIAFLPLAMVPGWFGQFWGVIPLVVAVAFLLSWFEALFVLPGHLRAVRLADPAARPGAIRRVQRTFAGGLEAFVARFYAPALRIAMQWRYTTVALMVLILAVTLAWPISGRMGFGLFPPIPRDSVRAFVTMPVDASAETVEAVRDRAVGAAGRVIAAHGGDAVAKGVEAEIEGTEITLMTHLRPGEDRPLTAAEFTRLWREEVGEIASAESSSFSSSFGGPGGGAGLQVALTHPDTAVLRAAASALTDRLSMFEAVVDPEDGFTEGKAELAFRVTEAGRALGLTSEEVGRQVRAAFQGVEALRQQDGRNEVTVRLRPPLAERRSEFDIETLILRTPEGGEVPLYQIAEVERSRADAVIRREDGARRVTVSANIEPPEQANRVVAGLSDEVLPALARDFPGLGYGFSGRQETQRETMESFRGSVALALLLIYAVLAIPFRSWMQPAIVMTAIPFGFAGAILGHLVVGMPLSVISLMGVIALGGVVINDALVMIDYANKARRAGAEAFEAIWLAGQRRFRPILLTTVTTFGGLAPMIFETSVQAQFLIPMAVSLGFGILFATTILLFLIPSLYMIVEDIRWLADPRPPEPQDDPREERPIAAE